MNSAKRRRKALRPFHAVAAARFMFVVLRGCEVSALFSYFNSTRTKCYLANGLTLGLYGAAYVIFRGKVIGKMVGAELPGPAVSMLLTVLTFGIFPGIMLPILAFKLGGARLGLPVLFFDVASLVSAVISGAILLVLSVGLWAQAVWLLAEAEYLTSVQREGA